MQNNNWKTWAKAALIRAVRTFAEAMLAYIGTGALATLDGTLCHIDVTWADQSGRTTLAYFAMTPEESWQLHR